VFVERNESTSFFRFFRREQLRLKNKIGWGEIYPH
jgi:hypothetical protein